MNCPACGKTIGENDALCPFCGQEIPNVSATYQTQYGTYTSEGQGVAHQPRKGLSIRKIGLTLKNAVVQLPVHCLDSFRDPCNLFTTLWKKGCWGDFTVGCLVSLLLAFLGGMLMFHAFSMLILSNIFSLYTEYPAVNFIRQAGAVSWGAAAAFGGITALIQLLVILIGCLVPLGYLCLFCKQPFHMDTVYSYALVLTLPTLPFALLAAILAMVSPWPAILVLVGGTVFSQCQSIRLINYVFPFKNQNNTLSLAAVCMVSVLLVCAVSMLIGVSFGSNQLISLWYQCKASLPSGNL